MPRPNPSRNPIIASVILSILTLFAGPAMAATGTIMPSPYQTLLDTSGNPVNNGKVCTYLAGTTTLTATYTDVALATPNANPIRTDTAGRFVAYLSPGASYKFIYQDASGTVGTCDGAVIKTVDNVSAVPPAAGNLDITGTAGEALTAGQVVYLSDGSGSKTAGQWFKADNTNTYSSTLPPLGMVPASIASGSAGTIRIAGSVTGLSSLVIGGPYFVGTGGALTATQPVNGRRVGNADTTSSLVLVASPLGYIPATGFNNTTGNITALTLPVSFSNTFVVYMTNASLSTIQGIAAGVVGQRLTIFSSGAGQVNFTYNDAAAAAGTKIITYATSGVTSLAAGIGSAEFVYDVAGRWQIVNHNQGDYITFTPTFTTSGAPTWTTVSVSQSKYYLSGRQLSVIFEYAASTVSAPILEIRSSLPSTFTVSSRSYVTDRIIDNGGAAALGGALAQTGDAFLRHYKDLTEAANWAASAANTQVRGAMTVIIL